MRARAGTSWRAGPSPTGTAYGEALAEPGRLGLPTDAPAFAAGLLELVGTTATGALPTAGPVPSGARHGT
ncbi:hypothetical protein [Streptomyces broussonetiae]|uniref:hypothetical protein n=1 Tax=Streptomyces broussonetiae TaxID=2686304 RepID=UPI0035D6F7BE